jgi:hypothetical protein
MEFGKEEYFDIIANICHLEHLKIRDKSLALLTWEKQ